MRGAVTRIGDDHAHRLIATRRAGFTTARSDNCGAGAMAGGMPGGRLPAALQPDFTLAINRRWAATLTLTVGSHPGYRAPPYGSTAST